MTAGSVQAPHRRIRARDAKERFLIDLLDALWARYRKKVAHVQRYEEMIRRHGARFVNDHVAFRTLALQQPPAGRSRIAPAFEALGYRGRACYEFEDKHLSSIHYEHPNRDLPKLFITQLKGWELSAGGRRRLARCLKSHRKPLGDGFLAALSGIERASPARKRALLRALDRYFEDLPWDLPEKRDVLAVEKESQYAAWVLVNGYDVNHFTVSVHSHGVPALDDIEKTAAAMRRAGIPMKPEIEGERGGKLRQTSTEPVVLAVAVKDRGRTVRIPWTYAYFEVAERPLFKDPASGRAERFEGFLGGQAAKLFEMTRLKK